MSSQSAKREKLDLNTSNDSLSKSADIIAQLDSLQDDVEKVLLKYDAEVVAIEKKFARMRNPLYAKRTAHIDKVPNFWLTTFMNHNAISNLITPEDEGVLMHLTRMELEEPEKPEATLKIHFHFSENPYFKNKLITRELTLSEGLVCLTKCCSNIDWYPGKNFLKKGNKKAQSNGFFNWLTSEKVDDYDEIGNVMREEIWTNPLTFFLMDEEHDLGGIGDHSSDEDDEDDDEDDCEVVGKGGELENGDDVDEDDEEEEA